MPDLIAIDDLLEHMERSELLQLAGVGSHNIPDARSLDTQKIEAAIKFASDMVRGYISRRYPIVAGIGPSETPTLIKGYVSDIVRHRLRHRSGNRNTTTEEAGSRYKDALAWLRDVSSGRVNIDLANVEGGDAAERVGGVNPSGKIHTTFTPTKAHEILEGY